MPWSSVLVQSKSSFSLVPQQRERLCVCCLMPTHTSLRTDPLTWWKTLIYTFHCRDILLHGLTLKQISFNSFIDLSKSFKRKVTEFFCFFFKHNKKNRNISKSCRKVMLVQTIFRLKKQAFHPDLKLTQAWKTIVSAVSKQKEKFTDFNLPR